MKNSNLIPGTILIVSLSIAHGCGSGKSMALNSAEKTSELRPGMPYDEVVELLGKPKSSQMNAEAWVVRWNLQEMWKGYVPCDMAFDPNSRELLCRSAGLLNRFSSNLN